ncbi:MAG: SDR family oxidoreductase, partial [Polyangiales bacterium]
MSNLSPHAPLQVQASLRGKHLVVGGATGFVGKVWLSHLLQQVPDIGHITLLVRAKRGQSAAARWQHTLLCSPTFRWLRAQHGQALFAWMAERVTVREARLEAPRLGLDEASYRQLGDSADAVLNFAGLTDFEADPRAALQVNIEVAMALAKLAQASPARRLLHISTAYVRGNASGHVPESLAVGRDARGAPFDAAAELTWLRALCARGSTRTRRIEGARARAIEHGWPNIYTYSKALAEHLLAANGTLQLSIVRPTIVEGAHRFPLPGWNEGVNTSAPLVWLLSSTFCRFPAQPEHRFDV